MKNNTFETIIGFLVLAIALFFFLFAYKLSNASTYKETYSLIANFESAEGINEGSEVMISGVKVGQVKSMILDPKEYSARLKLKINKDVKIPADSSAAIVSNGFLGGKFIAISAGQSDEMFKQGDKIAYTQPSLNLEGLIGKFLYSTGK